MPPRASSRGQRRSVDGSQQRSLRSERSVRSRISASSRENQHSRPDGTCGGSVVSELSMRSQGDNLSLNSGMRSARLEEIASQRLARAVAETEARVIAETEARVAARILEADQATQSAIDSASSAYRESRYYREEGLLVRRRLEVLEETGRGFQTAGPIRPSVPSST